VELPQLVDPMACIEAQIVYEGSIKSNQLMRLSEQLCGKSDLITYKLDFSQDPKGRCIVHCELTAGLHVICQRCNEEMALPVTVVSDLCVIPEDCTAQDLPKRYEPLVSVEGNIALLEVIEEELLLAIPMIPRHKEQDCPVHLSNDLLN